jgi:hypothetical protein
VAAQPHTKHWCGEIRRLVFPRTISESLGRYFWYLMVGHRRQPREDIPEIGVWIEILAAAGFGGIDDGSSLASFFDKQPIFHADGARGANGVFDQLLSMASQAVAQVPSFRGEFDFFHLDSGCPTPREIMAANS